MLQVYERGAILVKISSLKGKDLNLRAEPPRRVNVIELACGLYWEDIGRVHFFWTFMDRAEGEVRKLPKKVRDKYLPNRERTS